MGRFPRKDDNRDSEKNKQRDRSNLVNIVLMFTAVAAVVGTAVMYGEALQEKHREEQQNKGNEEVSGQFIQNARGYDLPRVLPAEQQDYTPRVGPIQDLQL